MTSEDLSKNPATTPEDEGETLAWTTHPVKHRPTVAVLVTLLILAMGIIVFYMTMSKAFAVLALLVLFFSLTKFYLPTHYRLTEKSVTVKTTTQTITKSWSNYRSMYPDKSGLLLSPFPVPSRLESFRGIYLIFAQNRDEVIRFADKQLKRAIAAESANQ